MQSWNHNSLITLMKNENYYDKNSVTMPKIIFYLSDDGNNMLANFKNRDWQFSFVHDFTFFSLIVSKNGGLYNTFL